MNRNIIRGLMLVGAIATVSTAASAAVGDPIDISTVTQSLELAKGALLSVIGAFLALSAGILALAMVQRYMKKKSGA